MALKIEVGDIFNEITGKDCIMVHGCNSLGVQGSGVAKIARDLYPHAYLAYKQVYKRHGLKVGQVVVSPQHNNGPIICHAITQKNFGRDGKAYASYDGIIVALQQIVKQFPDKPIHLPLIGGGLGGLDKKRLIAIFQAVFVDSDATLWLAED